MLIAAQDIWVHCNSLSADAKPFVQNPSAPPHSSHPTPALKPLLQPLLLLALLLLHHTESKLLCSALHQAGA
jgi:hypothetical protein